MDETKVCQLLALMSKNLPRGERERRPDLRIVSVRIRAAEKLWAGTRPDPIDLRFTAKLRGNMG